MSAAPQVYFRADASVQIGSGHVMRCLTLARGLAEAGYECHFICRDLPGALSDVIARQGYECHLLPAVVTEGGDPEAPPHGHWLAGTWQDDAEQVCDLLQGRRGAAWVIVDHYALDHRWEQTVRRVAPSVMVIDDLADRGHVCELVLDQTLGRDGGDYDGLVPACATRLMGPEFALLRPEFADHRAASLARQCDGQLRHIVVSMGGVDADNITGTVLDMLARLHRDLPELEQVSVILGAAAPWKEAVQKVADTMPVRTDVCVDVRNMAALLAGCDLAIGAAGGSAMERCALGLPSLIIVMAENQWPGATALTTHGAAVLAGDVATNDWAATLERAVLDLRDDERRRAVSQAAAGLVGAAGVANVVGAINARELSCRTADMGDARNVWDWRYANGAERYYPSPRPARYSDHEAWFERALGNDDRQLLMIEEGGVAVAHVRLDQGSGEQVVSICVDPEAQGRSIGARALALLHSSKHVTRPGRIVAEVHAQNAASIKLFQKAGYSHAASHGQFWVFHKNLS